MLTHRYFNVSPRAGEGREPAITTALETRTTADGLSIDVATADGRRSEADPTVVFFLPWSEYVARPDASDRYRLMAETMGARVIALDNLGVGNGTSKIPRAMARDIAHGDFSGNAKTQLEVLRSDLSVDLAHMALFGYSLGGAVATSFAKELGRDGHVDSMTLLETAGLRAQRFGRVVYDFARESIQWNRQYIKDGTLQYDWMSRPGEDATMLRRILTSPAGYYVYPQGLSHARLLDDIEDAYDLSIDDSTRFRIVNGSESIVSKTEDNDALADALNRLGVEHVSRQILNGESHGIVDGPRKFEQILN